MINRGATVRLHAIRGTKLLIEGGSSPLRNVVEYAERKSGDLHVDTRFESKFSNEHPRR